MSLVDGFDRNGFSERAEGRVFVPLSAEPADHIRNKAAFMFERMTEHFAMTALKVGHRDRGSFRYVAEQLS